jgi:hypothetical protein
VLSPAEHDLTKAAYTEVPSGSSPLLDELKVSKKIEQLRSKLPSKRSSSLPAPFAGRKPSRLYSMQGRHRGQVEGASVVFEGADIFISSM